MEGEMEKRKELGNFYCFAFIALSHIGFSFKSSWVIFQMPVFMLQMKLSPMLPKISKIFLDILLFPLSTKAL